MRLPPGYCHLSVISDFAQNVCALACVVRMHVYVLARSNIIVHAPPPLPSLHQRVCTSVRIAAATTASSP